MFETACFMRQLRPFPLLVAIATMMASAATAVPIQLRAGTITYIVDPTSLVLIDEADRLKLASLEAVRDVFDRSQIGLLLLGMPGIEKRLARYPQFYSRIGFVHEFRPLSTAEVRRLLTGAWTPPGIHLPPLDEETMAAIVRITGGNFRLLGRLLAQTERIVEINELPKVTCQAVEAARESLVIGQTG